jgi:hypothetical protein
MAIALVSHTIITGVNGGTTTAINTTGASLLVVVTTQNGANTVVFPSDSLVNTWTKLTGQVNATNTANTIFYVANPIVGASQTFTISGTTDYLNMQILAFSGTAVGPIDLSTGGQAANPALTVQPGSVTPTVANSLVVTGFSAATGSTTNETINLGFTITDQAQEAGGVNFAGGAAYLIQTTATAVNPTWTNTFSPTQYCATIASFKPSASIIGVAIGSSNDPAVSAYKIATTGTATGGDLSPFSLAFSQAFLGIISTMAVGASNASIIGVATGTTNDPAVGASLAKTTGASTGTSTDPAVSATLLAITGTSIGTSTDPGVGSSLAQTTGTATGSSIDPATGGALIPAIGTSTGSSNDPAIGASLAQTTGVATGLGLISGISLQGVTIGSALGSSSDLAVSASTASMIGRATGSAAVAATIIVNAMMIGRAIGTSIDYGAVGANFPQLTIGSSSGTGIAQGVMTQVFIQVRRPMVSWIH